MASFSMLNFDEAKNSYIEEEDRTYIYNTTNEGVSSEEEDDDEAEDDDESENQGLSRKSSDTDLDVTDSGVTEKLNLKSQKAVDTATPPPFRASSNSFW